MDYTTQSVESILVFHETVSRECIRRSFTNIFSWFEPIWATDNRLKYFRILFRFRWDFRIFKQLRSGMHPFAESISAVCITPISQSLRCASHCAVNLSGVMHTAKSISTVCIIPRSQVFQILREKNRSARSHWWVFFCWKYNTLCCGQSYEKINDLQWRSKTWSMHHGEARVRVQTQFSIS